MSLEQAKVFKQRLGASGVALRPKTGSQEADLLKFLSECCDRIANTLMELRAARQQGYDVHGLHLKASNGLQPAASMAL